MKRKISSVIILLTVLIYSSRKEQPATEQVTFKYLMTNISGCLNGFAPLASFTSGNVNFVNHYDPRFRGF